MAGLGPGIGKQHEDPGKGRLREPVDQEPGVVARVPGIGKRTAEKVVVDLKDKLEPAEGELAGLAIAIDADAEVMEALTGLGYSVVEAQRALQQIPADVTSVEDRLRTALVQFGE